MDAIKIVSKFLETMDNTFAFTLAGIIVPLSFRPHSTLKARRVSITILISLFNHSSPAINAGIHCNKYQQQGEIVPQGHQSRCARDRKLQLRHCLSLSRPPDEGSFLCKESIDRGRNDGIIHDPDSIIR